MAFVREGPRLEVLVAQRIDDPPDVHATNKWQSDRFFRSADQGFPVDEVVAHAADQVQVVADHEKPQASFADDRQHGVKELRCDM